MATAKKVPPETAAVKVAPPKAPAKTASAKPAAPKSAKPPSTTKGNGKAKTVGHVVPEEQRAHYIEVAAFYIAERRGFIPGDPLQDWLAAEVEINRLLVEGRLG